MSEKGGGSGGGSPQASAVTVSDVQELIRRKEEIEAQIKANYGLLESVSVGSGLREAWGRPDPGTGKPMASQLRPLSVERGSPTLRTKLRESSPAFVEPVPCAGRGFTCVRSVGELMAPSQQPFDVSSVISPILGDEDTEAFA